MVPFVPVSVALVLIDVAVTPTGSMALISSRPPLRAQYRVRRMSRRFTPTTVTHAMHPLKYLRKIIPDDGKDETAGETAHGNHQPRVEQIFEVVLDHVAR